jgi:hypothetical protein
MTCLVSLMFVTRNSLFSVSYCECHKEASDIVDIVHMRGHLSGVSEFHSVHIQWKCVFRISSGLWCMQSVHWKGYVWELSNFSATSPLIIICLKTSELWDFSSATSHVVNMMQACVCVYVVTVPGTVMLLSARGRSSSGRRWHESIRLVMTCCHTPCMTRNWWCLRHCRNRPVAPALLGGPRCHPGNTIHVTFSYLLA